MLNGGRENGTSSPMCHIYDAGQHFGPGTPPRRNGVTMRSLNRRSSPYPYYLQHPDLNDFVQSDICDEMAELRSSQAETNALLRTLVQNDEKRSEEIQAVKREQEFIKGEIGILKQVQDQMAEKLGQLENGLESICQIVQDRVNSTATPGLKPGEHPEGKARALGEERRRRGATASSCRTLNKGRIKCKFCGTAYAPSWVRRHEAKACKLRPNCNPEGQQQHESLMGQAAEFPMVEHKVTLDQVEVPLGLGDISGNEEGFYFELIPSEADLPQ